jgi:hypothetical protein
MPEIPDEAGGTLGAHKKPDIFLEQRYLPWKPGEDWGYTPIPMDHPAYTLFYKYPNAVPDNFLRRLVTECHLTEAEAQRNAGILNVFTTWLSLDWDELREEHRRRLKQYEELERSIDDIVPKLVDLIPWPRAKKAFEDLEYARESARYEAAWLRASLKETLKPNFNLRRYKYWFEIIRWWVFGLARPIGTGADAITGDANGPLSRYIALLSENVLEPEDRTPQAIRSFLRRYASTIKEHADNLQRVDSDRDDAVYPGNAQPYSSILVPGRLTR